jgi:hypothetical protein|tara:strand:+ start:464 stop:742 length:279 start_codon:yes stop_codon:yes gene_type:complete
LLEKTGNGVIINIIVKPLAKLFEIRLSEVKIKVFCKSSPIRGKANREVMKELSKIFKHEVIIIAGHKNSAKKILVEGITLESARSVLDELNR